MRKTQSIRFIAVFTALMAAFQIGCQKEGPIKLGFVGGLTGRLSDLGTSGRDGAILAVEKANQEGGINGREVALIIRDDKQNPNVAKSAQRDFRAMNAAAVVGHMTSAMSVAVMDEINQAKMVLVSPTTSTNVLSGKDDYFFRILAPSHDEIRHMAQLARKMGYFTVSIVADKSNDAYSMDYADTFASVFKQWGGRVLTVLSVFLQIRSRL